MRVAVIGAGGQLAAAIIHECRDVHEITELSRADLDVSDDGAVEQAMARARPEAIVNGAAFNDVDGAEDRPIDALNINAFGVRALARAAQTHGALLVHYSTDFVFDGRATQPYTEEDKPNPRSVYAASKLLGEWFALDVPRAYVLRVETLFGRAPGGGQPKGSIASITNTLVGGGTPTVFEDRTVSPTFVLDAARATKQLLELQAPTGLYHCVNSGACTWVELARELARLLGVKPRLKPTRMADVPMRAARPQYCALDNRKLQALGIAMPSWQDALSRYVSSIR